MQSTDTWSWDHSDNWKPKGAKKNGGVSAELKTMVVTGYGGVARKVGGIKMLVLQILLAQQNIQLYYN